MEPQPMMPTTAPLGRSRLFFFSISRSPLPCTLSVTRVCSFAAPVHVAEVPLTGRQPGPPSAPLRSSKHPELGTQCAERGLRAKADILYGRAPADAHIHISRCAPQRITARAHHRSLGYYCRYHSAELTAASQRERPEKCKLIRLIKQGCRCY